MELKKARPTGTTSASGNSLQHEAAMRVEERYRAEERRRRHAQMVKSIKNSFLMFLFLFIVGGGIYAWRTGMLDAARPALGLGGDGKGSESGGNADAEGTNAPADSQTADLVVKRIEEHIDAFNETTARFEGATLAYWKDAIPEDKPAAKGPPLAYTALVPDAKGGRVFLDVRLAGDNSMKIRQLKRTRESAEISQAEFDKMIETTPFLVLREHRAYYCSAKKPFQKTGLPVPAKGKPFNPSRQEFGALYDQVLAAKLAPPAFKYDVFLIHPTLKKIAVATVGFGEEVTREHFEAAIQALGDKKLIDAYLKNGKMDFGHAQKR